MIEVWIHRLLGRAASPLLLALGMCALAAGALAQAGSRPLRAGDYIVAVVNSELVTAYEVEQRTGRIREEARRNGREPPGDSLHGQVLDLLIDERVLVTYARESGAKVDEAEIDRAVNSVAAANRMSLPDMRRRLAAEGLEFARFRSNLRDQILVERVREREVQQRIRISDTEVERYLEQYKVASAASLELNLAQILISVPDNAGDAVVAERRARIDAAVARLRGGADFGDVAREVSEDGNRANGGTIGLRPASRLPDVFVEKARDLKVGEVSEPFRSSGGFHVLKVLERRDGEAMRVTQTRARHILLRTSAQASVQDASRRLLDLKRQIESGQRRFEEVARDVSEDGSASSGGDLGWVSPGGFVPEFEEAMNRLEPAGALSPPVVSRFGVHLIQVIERRDAELTPKEVRDQARAALREKKFETAYQEWAKDLRARAYIEMREPPQQ
jgi:peptidyl-prolyl cis-trans isomerase SurA